MKLRLGQITVAAMLALVAALFPAYAAYADEVHEIPLVMIVVEYDGGSDPEAAVLYDDDYNWSAALFSEGESPASYYRDMSGGSFTFTPAKETSETGVDDNTNNADRVDDGVIHVTLRERHDAWGAVNVDRDVTSDFVQMVMRALDAASSRIDFAAYDTNGDGVISQDELAICLCIAGYEASPITDFRRTDVPLMWAHAGILAFTSARDQTVDNLRFETYIAISERYWEEYDPIETAEYEPLGIVYHELGHALGLPDLYTVKYTEGAWSDSKIGPLSLMDEGGWQYADVGDGLRNIPTALDAWSRYVLGWTEPTIVAHSGDFRVSSQLSDSGYTALIIPTRDPDEYFLVENRQAEGHDVSLAPDYLGPGGVVIWHVDNAMYERYYDANQVNDANHRPAVMADDAAGETSVNLMLYSNENDTPDALENAGITLQFDANPGRDTIVHVELDDKAGVLNTTHLLNDVAKSQLGMTDDKDLFDSIMPLLKAAIKH